MFPLPLRVETRLSPSARVVSLAAHTAALAALFVAWLPTAVSLAGTALLGASLWTTWKRQASLRLRAKADGQLEIWRNTSWKPLRLLPDSVVLPWLIVLRWREDGRRHSLMLPGDALPNDDHRRLRVWLRWKAEGGVTPLQ